MTGSGSGAQAWDLAAGVVIAREAGALVQPLDPQGDILGDGEIVAANEALFDKFARVIRDRG